MADEPTATPLTDDERMLLALAVQRLTMHPAPKGTWDLSSVRNPIETTVDRIVAERLKAVVAFAVENEAWESQVPRGPGNASYVNGFENGWRAVATDLRDLLAKPRKPPVSRAERPGGDS